jgi:Asp-tRNA(Asn)/Glu-tRNA(Gln) amidotransferase A subunit family amidase
LTGISVPAGTYPVSELTGKKVEESVETESVLPFGVTLIGGSRTDAEVLEVARRFEEAFKKSLKR